MDIFATGTVDKVKDYLSHGGRVEVQDMDGNTALMIAISYNRPDIVEIILQDRSPNLLHLNHNFDTSLYLACKSRNVPILKLLLIKISKRREFLIELTRCLFHSIINGPIEIVSMLLSSGACVNTPYKDFGTALVVSFKYNCSDVVELLLTHGATFTPSEGHQLILWCCKCGYFVILKLILARTRSISPQLLHQYRNIALRHDHKSVVSLLQEIDGIDFHDMELQRSKPMVGVNPEPPQEAIDIGETSDLPKLGAVSEAISHEKMNDKDSGTTSTGEAPTHESLYENTTETNVNEIMVQNRYNLVIEEKNNMFHDREAVNRQLLAGMQEKSHQVLKDEKVKLKEDLQFMTQKVEEMTSELQYLRSVCQDFETVNTDRLTRESYSQTQRLVEIQRLMSEYLEQNKLNDLSGINEELVGLFTDTHNSISYELVSNLLHRHDRSNNKKFD